MDTSRKSFRAQEGTFYELELHQVIALSNRITWYKEVHRCTIKKPTPENSDTLLKIIKLSMKLEDEAKDRYDALLNFRHENIASYLAYGQNFNSEEIRTSEPSGFCLYVLLDFVAGGSLANHCRTTEISLRDKQRYTKQILLGLTYLHDEKRIIHGDLKGDNIRLTRDMRTIKICDLDGVVCNRLTSTQNEDIFGQTGTCCFRSPETLSSGITSGHPHSILSKATDIWSLGCILLQMCGRGKIFFKLYSECLEAEKRYADFRYFLMAGGLPEIPQSAPDCLQNFVHSCLQFDPNLRFNCSDLLNHLFITTAPDRMSYSSNPEKNSIRTEQTYHIMTKQELQRILTYNGYQPSEQQYQEMISQAALVGNVTSKIELTVYLSNFLQESQGLHVIGQHISCPGTNYGDETDSSVTSCPHHGCIELKWPEDDEPAPLGSFDDCNSLADLTQAIVDESLA